MLPSAVFQRGENSKDAHGKQADPSQAALDFHVLPLCARGRETALPCYCDLHLTTTRGINWCVTRTSVHIHKHVLAFQTLQSSSEYRHSQKLMVSKAR